MIISDSRQFVFVHIEKTAGTSIGQAIIPYANLRHDNKWYSFLRLLGLPKGYQGYKFRTHAPLKDLIGRMPDDTFQTYFKFAFIRNPWDRLVSEYNAAVKKNKRRRHQRIRELESFRNFVEFEIRRGKFFQYPMLLDQSQKIGVDFVGRFENLNTDFEHVCQTIGIENTLGHFNRFSHASYKDYYDTATRELVAENWQKEIEAFEYEF